jgi:hypothetical protein
MILPDNGSFFEVDRTDESIRERLLEGFSPRTPTSHLLDAQRATIMARLEAFFLAPAAPPEGEWKVMRGRGPTMVAHKFSGHFPEDQISTMLKIY